MTKRTPGHNAFMVFGTLAEATSAALDTDYIVSFESIATGFTTYAWTDNPEVTMHDRKKLVILREPLPPVSELPDQERPTQQDKWLKDTLVLLNVPMKDWVSVLGAMPKDKRMEVHSSLSTLMERAARLKGYMEGRYMYSERSHEFAVKASNKLAMRVRKLLGFAYPKQDITF